MATAYQQAYSEKLKDPRWQKLRLEIFQRDGWACVSCKRKDTCLHVHHWYYEQGKEPWEYPMECFSTLCENCHNDEYVARKHCEGQLLDLLKQLHWTVHDIIGLAVAIRLTGKDRFGPMYGGLLSSDDVQLEKLKKQYHDHLGNEKVDARFDQIIEELRPRFNV